MLKNSRCSSQLAEATLYAAHQRLAVHHQSDHDELAVFEAQRFVAGAGKGEIRIRPVVYGQYFLGIECCHLSFLSVNPSEHAGRADDGLKGFSDDLSRL